MDMKEPEMKELNTEDMEQVTGAGVIQNQGHLSMQIRYMKSKGYSVEGILDNICRFAVQSGYLVHPRQNDYRKLIDFIRTIYDTTPDRKEQGD